MPVSDSKIYNDAPDEFAEFLDSGRYEVSLSDLGGVNNPFVKEGIYRECCFRAEYAADYYGQYAYCPDCGNKFYFNHDFDKYNCLEWKCEDCGSELFIYENDSIHFTIEHARLAEFMSKGLGCSVCRQFKKTGWLFGKLRGYDVYFACTPTAGMYRALESTPNSILVIGQNTPKNLPPALATRVIYLARLLYVKDGALHFANEVVGEKIPLPRGHTAKATKQDETPAKNPSHLPVQIYTPYYLMMMGVWLEKLQKEGKHGRPKKPWIAKWLHKNGPSFLRGREPLSPRQIYRHINALTGKTRAPKGKPDCRSAEFIIRWDGCRDMAYVSGYTGEGLADAILKASESSRKLEYEIGPTRSVDAATLAVDPGDDDDDDRRS